MMKINLEFKAVQWEYINQESGVILKKKCMKIEFSFSPLSTPVWWDVVGEM